ncbi:CBS domain-containing protein [Lysinibacter sp. HNR]|uniref:magnesium transporter MgtE N-terminal domain-containing protein n=1 Tax=Lysinibacter sp. HNR TaxID=3031408 RepID=UPI002435B7B8|nr:CBS domain-containing protein [Lysinibacter sp. HNR]WGD38376.1 CBS domain-containing protein [Lysinibacter sp. HNR]
MSTSRVFVGRLSGCGVFDPVGDRVGRARDVIVVYRNSGAPRVVGMVIEIPGRKRVFVSIGRITSIGAGQVITTGLINVRRFEQRGGEVRIISEMIGRTVDFVNGGGEATIEDVAIEKNRTGIWEVSSLFVRQRRNGGSPFSRGNTSIASWNEVRERTLPGGTQSAEHLIATYSDLKPADLAGTLLDLPRERMLSVVAELPDDRLADVLEEMTESDQIVILASLNDKRAADVLDNMQADDAADLIAQLPEAEGEHLLTLMEPDEADDVRMLLTYDHDTAGGLMSPDPIVVSAEATVAEGLALISKHELAPAMAAAVCVTLPPYETPTGKLLGIVHFQRMLRYPPHERLGNLVDEGLEVRVDTPATEVSRILATYNLVSVPVIDSDDRLMGVVTVDDVLDHLLPDDWRSYETADRLDRQESVVSDLKGGR